MPWYLIGAAVLVTCYILPKSFYIKGVYKKTVKCGLQNSYKAAQEILSTKFSTYYFCKIIFIMYKVAVNIKGWTTLTNMIIYQFEVSQELKFTTTSDSLELSGE